MKLWSKFDPNRLLADSVVAISLRLCALVLSLLTSIVLARSLGQEGLGIYALVMTMLLFIEIPAGLGQPTLMTREIAQARSMGSSAEIHRLQRMSALLVFGVSLFIAVLMAGLAWLFQPFGPGAMLTAFILAMCLLPVSRLQELLAGILRGVGRVRRGQVLQNLLRPGFFLIFVWSMWLFLPQYLTAQIAIVCQISAVSLTLVVGGFWISRDGQAREKDRGGARSYAELVSLGAPFILVTGMQYVQSRIDILCLGVLMDESAVGLYHVASRGTLLVSLPLGAVSWFIMPRIAALHTLGQNGPLQSLVTNCTLIGASGSVAVGIPMLLWADELLGIIFGAVFIAAAAPFSVLVVAQMIHALAGSSVPLLKMTGHPGSIARVMVMTSIINIALNFLFIPQFGLMGAAYATGFSTVLSSIWLVARCMNATGINPSITPLLSLAKYSKSCE